jgi:hypothetical protein
MIESEVRGSGKNCGIAAAPVSDKQGLGRPEEKEHERLLEVDRRTSRA